MEKKTKWNEKLKTFVGKTVSCDKFEKDGLETEGYIINSNGSLSFYNESRSLNAAMSLVTGEFKTHWNNIQKSNFLKAVQLV